jgi:hypothetical protein
MLPSTSADILIQRTLARIGNTAAGCEKVKGMFNVINDHGGSAAMRIRLVGRDS